MENSWMHVRNRLSKEYRDGVKAFIEVQKQNGKDKCKCPCRDCLETSLLDLATIGKHLVVRGLSSTFVARCISNANPLEDEESEEEEDDMIGMFDDAFGPYNHCGGSKSFVQYQYEDQNGNTLEKSKGDIQLFYDTHFHKENGWIDSVAKLRYEKMLELKNSEGNEMTEAEICREVLGKKSGYVKGRGFGPLPLSSTSRHSQENTRAEIEELRSKVLRLEELVTSCKETNVANQVRTDAILKKLQESSPAFANLFTEDLHLT